MTQDNKLKQFKISVPMSWNEVFTIDARDYKHARQILDASLGYADDESENFQSWIADGMHDNWGDATPEWDNIEIEKMYNGRSYMVKLNSIPRGDFND